MRHHGRAGARGLLLSLALVVAGCVGTPAAPPSSPDSGSDADDAAVPPQGAPPGTEADAPEGASLAVSYTQRACAQLHLFYPSTWSGWEAIMPPGFGPDGSDPAGATTTIYQHVSRCERTAEDGTTTTFDEAWVGVRVTPPPEMSDPAAPVQLVPLDIVLSDPALVALYQAWGFGVARLGEVAWTDTPTPAGRLGEVVIRGEGATMTLRTVIGPPTEGSVAGSDRVFAITDRAVTGWFDYAWPGWTDVGMGDVVFTAEGGDAPPVYDGLAHQVADTDVTVTFTPAPAAA